MEIKLELEFGFEFLPGDPNKFRLYINGDKVKTTWLEARKLYKLLYKRVIEDEKYKKIENEKEAKDRIKKVVI